VEKMGSKIQVQSQVGMGSVFWFELEMPEAKEWGAIAKRTEQGIITGYQGETKTILIADDKWENCSVIVSLLTPLGFHVLEVPDGKAALEQLTTHAIDLLITDINMPELNGYELIQAVQQIPELNHLPVVVSSASVFDTEQERSLDAGADAFLPKPIEADRLLDLLQTVLKLTWIYAPATDHPPLSSVSLSPQPTQSADPSNFVLPEEAVLNALCDFACQGNLKGIITLAEQIQREDVTLQPFAHYVQSLAQSFQEKQLLTFLQESQHQKSL
jgi:CheY-like chemotaxis protein